MTPAAAYSELIQRTREESLLASVGELLGWDELTFMPLGGAAHRGNQLAYLAGLQHEWGTDPRLNELLAVIEGTDLVSDPESPAAVNVRELRRLYDRARRLPRKLVEESARVTTLAQQEWAAARQKNKFAVFRPWLERLVNLARHEAECLSNGGPLYDALLEEYEPGATAAELARLFATLKCALVPLVEAIQGAKRRPDVTWLQRDFPLPRQRVFAEAAAAALGYDFTRGRLDTAVHPFSATIGPGDSRITIRYDPRNFCEAFFATLHEVGHALYDQGLDPEHQGTPMGTAVSLGLHESQARLWENTVGRSRAFWRHFFPRARQVFPETLADATLDGFHFAVNAVRPSLNRVRADAVTYDLHILIRFELEQGLIAGDLKPADLPDAWNAAYQRDLGLTPANDAEGCLQDGHWAAGLIGYFPTYTLGNLYAAQLFAAAQREVGDVDESFARGDFVPMLDWLRASIHRHGSRWPAARLIQEATGEAPNPRFFVEALRVKYGELYGL